MSDICSFSFVKFLMADRRFVNLMEGLRKGGDFKKIFSETFGATPDQRFETADIVVGRQNLVGEVLIGLDRRNGDGQQEIGAAGDVPGAGASRIQRASARGAIAPVQHDVELVSRCQAVINRERAHGDRTSVDAFNGRHRPAGNGEERDCRRNCRKRPARPE